MWVYHDMDKLNMFNVYPGIPRPPFEPGGPRWPGSPGKPSNPFGPGDPR